jgi:hypothetical protein
VSLAVLFLTAAIFARRAPLQLYVACGLGARMIIVFFLAPYCLHYYAFEIFLVAAVLPFQIALDRSVPKLN